MHKLKPAVPPIEAFVISVVLGIAGITAFGQFQDLSAGHPVSLSGIDAKTSSAAAINYAARILEPPPVSMAQQGAVEECSEGTRSAAFPSDYGLADYGSDETGITCP